MTETNSLTMLAPEVTPEQQMKLLYPNRPWEREPDDAEWYDARTGYKCAIRRHETLKHLNGYVGVFVGHPAHGLDYPDLDIPVHGGLTYSNTDKAAVRWFGFDCGHGGDFSPGIAMLMMKYVPEKEEMLRTRSDEVYRTWEFVERQVQNLVAGLWNVEERTRWPDCGIKLHEAKLAGELHDE